MDAKLGKGIEHAVRLNVGSGIYASVKVKSKRNSQARNIWLNFDVGKEEPGRYGSNEWIVCIAPYEKEGEWSIFCVNFDDPVKKTEGKDGWKFSQINCFRIYDIFQRRH